VQKISSLWRPARDLAALCQSNTTHLIAWTEFLNEHSNTATVLGAESADDIGSTTAVLDEPSHEDIRNEAVLHDVDNHEDDDEMTEYETDDGSPLVQPKTPTQQQKSLAQLTFLRRFSNSTEREIPNSI